MNDLFLIGGGELKTFETIDIDNTIVSFVKKRFPEKERIESLFVPLASYDSKPYFNTFRKAYQSKLKTHSDVAIIARGEMTREHIIEKIEKSDLIYFGGGNTRYLLEKLDEYDLTGEFIKALNSGVTVAGLSAGMNMWFEKFLSDSDIMDGISNEYVLLNGLGVLEGVCCPHYDTAYGKAFDEYVEKNYVEGERYLCVENDCCVYFEDGEMKYCFGKGNAYLLEKQNGSLKKTPVPKIPLIEYSI